VHLGVHEDIKMKMTIKKVAEGTTQLRTIIENVVKTTVLLAIIWQSVSEFLK
jgi:hypothetical protein